MNIETEIKKIMVLSGKDEQWVRQQMRETIDEFNGLIDEDGALVIISKHYSNGESSVVMVTQVFELPPNTKVTVEGNIRDAKTYWYHNQKDRKYVKCYLDDDTGAVQIIFWDFVEIKNGDSVRISNLMVRLYCGEHQLQSTKTTAIQTIPNPCHTDFTEAVYKVISDYCKNISKDGVFENEIGEQIKGLTPAKLEEILHKLEQEIRCFKVEPHKWAVY